MTRTTLSSREFNHAASKGKKAAKSGPVVITDCGRPAHVLLSFKDYKNLTGGRTRIADLLAMPGVEDIEFDAAKVTDLAQATDLKLMNLLDSLALVKDHADAKDELRLILLEKRQAVRLLKVTSYA